MRLGFAIFLVMIGANFSLADILSVKEPSAEIRDSADPFTAQVILVVPQYYPLNVVGDAGGYYKVNDFLGREGWVEKGAIELARSVVVKVNSGNIRNGPGTGHEILFRANRGVAFKVLAQQKDWLKVEHESKRTGWISRTLVWGDS
ncbi:MAG: SH3 domain-containing protein [Desulfuromonadales bacterium]|nr:SH3 domain-containing protein [Desulfuromonadales bacterium]